MDKNDSDIVFERAVPIVLLLTGNEVGTKGASENKSNKISV